MDVNDKITHILAEALAGLHPEDLALRIRQCQATGQIGATMHERGEVLEFEWPAGEILAVVDRSLFGDDAELGPAEWVLECPDVIPDDWRVE